MGVPVFYPDLWMSQSYYADLQTSAVDDALVHEHRLAAADTGETPGGAGDGFAVGQTSQAAVRIGNDDGLGVLGNRPQQSRARGKVRPAPRRSRR